ncbi:hypothetical protein PG995_006306 [Apiospora arundinis]
MESFGARDRRSSCTITPQFSAADEPQNTTGKVFRQPHHDQERDDEETDIPIAEFISMHFVIKELLQYVKCKAVFFEFDGLGSGPYGHHLQVQPSEDRSMQQVLLR